MSIELLKQYKRILALAEAGIYYGHDAFDQERYHELKEIALGLIANLGNEPVEELTELFRRNEGYPTPKVDVRGFVRQGDKVLLVEDRKLKQWSLPGGYAEIGLSPRENVVKEVLEEAGLNVQADRLAAVFDTSQRPDVPQLFQYYKLVFACSVQDGAFVENLETTNSGYFSLDQLPPLDLPRTTPEQLKILMENGETHFE